MQYRECCTRGGYGLPRWRRANQHRRVLRRGTLLVEGGHSSAEPRSQAGVGAPGEPSYEEAKAQACQGSRLSLKVLSDPEALGQVALGTVRMLGNLGEQGSMGQLARPLDEKDSAVSTGNKAKTRVLLGLQDMAAGPCSPS